MHVSVFYLVICCIFCVVSSSNDVSADFADTMPRFSEIAKQRKSKAKKSEKEDKKRMLIPLFDKLCCFGFWFSLILLVCLYGCHVILSWS